MEFWARQDLEKLADTILLDCFADGYEKDHMPTNIDLLAEKYLGLNVSYMRLSEELNHILRRKRPCPDQV